jgi:hypothetical protein
MVRQGAIDSPPKTPFILGFECAGEVAEIGEGVTDFKVSELLQSLRVMVARLDLRTFVKHLLIMEYFWVSGRQVPFEHRPFQGFSYYGTRTTRAYQKNDKKFFNKYIYIENLLNLLFI